MDPMSALLSQGNGMLGSVVSGIFNAGENRKNRNWEREQLYNQAREQYGMSRAQDLLGAETRSAQYDYLKSSIPEYTPYQYSKPNEDIYRRTADIGLQNIQEQGRRALSGQNEQLSSMGLGASSIGIGAGQRMMQRTLQEQASLEAEYSQQQAQRQMQYEQLMSAEQARATQAAGERASLLAGYMGPSSADIESKYAQFKPKAPVAERGLFGNLFDNNDTAQKAQSSFLYDVNKAKSAGFGY